MSHFNLGDVVMVVGNIDTRVREKATDGVVAGTIEQFLFENQVSVLLPDGDIWVGHVREIILLDEQN
jgi:hypothetical protein